MVERDRIYIIILGGYEIDIVTVKNIGNFTMDAFKILDEILEQKNKEEYERRVTDPLYMASVEAEKQASIYLQQLKTDAERQSNKIKEDAKREYEQMKSSIDSVVSNAQKKSEEEAMRLKKMKEEMATLESKRNEHNSLENTFCCVCLDNKKSILLVPCNHACVCDGCIAQIYYTTKLCPICRTSITEYKHIYL